MIDLFNMIDKYVHLPASPSKQGWYSVQCRVCNDHGRKGLRAAFKFDSEQSLGYHCFNCEHIATFHTKQTEPLSQELITLFEAYGIPESEWNSLHIITLENRSNNLSLERTQKVVDSTEPAAIPFPDHFKLLVDLDSTHSFYKTVEEYLTTKRHMSVIDYPFMYSTGKSDGDDKAYKWKNRLIIPIFDNANKLIYYQGRDLTGSAVKKYLSPAITKNKIMYGFNNIYDSKYRDDPIYIVEGFFDAFHLNGCATMGNNLSDEMIERLNRSGREKVLVPDKIKGIGMAKKALKVGWKISTPDIGDCTDINEAIVRYGVLYVISSITSNTYGSVVGEVMANSYCES